jgi:hypothetical protein
MNTATAAYVSPDVMRVGLLALLALGVASSAAAQDGARALPPPWPPPPPGATLPPTHPEAPMPSPEWDPDGALRSAREHAAPGAQRVLDATRTMLDEDTIVLGSCFTWVEALFHRAGGVQHEVYRGSRHSGPYAEAAVLLPGDWVFFLNRGFEDVTHSAVFVAWVDEPSRVALMVSYPGGRRQEPGRFGTYELTGVYRVMRMDDAPPPPPRPVRSRARHPRH